jgi:hypothetical protein
MHFNTPRASASHGPPFFEDSHYYSQETAAIIQTAWNENIDPLLQNSPISRENPSQEIKMSLQNQVPPPLERYLSHTENHFLYDPDRMQHHSRGLPHTLTRPAAPIHSLPQTPSHRLTSPCPSHDPTSSCGSARTPGSETEWQESQYSPMPYSRDEFYLPQTTSFIGQGFPEWTGIPHQTFSQQNGFPCVQMSQIQGLPDLQPEEGMFESIDEGYNSIDMKNVYPMDDNQIPHMKHEHSTRYSYQVDEGLGASIKDEGSLPDITASQSHVDAMSEADADGEAEEDIEPIPEPVSDAEYTPKPSRTRKVRSPRTSQYHHIKSGRIHKSPPKSRNNLTCKQCEHVPFKDTTALQRHITSSHTRAFVCVFYFAGCKATFTSKNEWKRHVSSQHLNLTAWVCDQGTCGKNHASGKGKPAEFNRKDLFTQHLRRMHTPFQVKRNKDKKNMEWEERLKDLQKECLITKREPPNQLTCPLQSCGLYFEGQGTWDDRMEHVGKHLEKAAAGVGEHVRQEDDTLLVEWALKEGIVQVKPGYVGVYQLCVDPGSAKKDEDRDADGEEDFQ